MVNTKTIGAFIAGSIFFVIVALLISIFNNNHFWVMPLNQSGKPINDFQILIDQKYFGLEGSAIGSGDSKQIFAEVNSTGNYSAIVTFSDGKKLISEARKINPGMGIYEHIYSNRIEHEVRVR